MAKVKIIDGVIVLLDSSSKDVVYYAVGVLINIISREEVT